MSKPKQKPPLSCVWCTDPDDVSTPVVLRVWRTDPADVFALFPAIPASASGYECQSYQHRGQHGAADYDLCIRKSRPARAQEAADLLRELRRIGYRPKMIRRASRCYLNQRLTTLKHPTLEHAT